MGRWTKWRGFPNAAAKQLIMNLSKLLSLLTSALVAAAAGIASGQSAVVFSSQEDFAASIKAVPCQQKDRLEGVRRLFKEAGAQDGEIRIEKFDNDKGANVIVRKNGAADETIIIGAHYDKVSLGCGVVDNWTGVAILAHVYKTIRTLDTQKSYIFAAFDREEEGLRGSRHMVKAMDKPAIEKTCAMVNFDSFGQALPMSLRSASSPKMLKLAGEMADESKFKFIAVDIAGASSDSAAFREKRIPAITLSGIAGDWQQILHSTADQIGKVNIESVYIGYRFGLGYISKLDSSPCGHFR